MLMEVYRTAGHGPVRRAARRFCGAVFETFEMHNQPYPRAVLCWINIVLQGVLVIPRSPLRLMSCQY